MKILIAQCLCIMTQLYNYYLKFILFVIEGHIYYSLKIKIYIDVINIQVINL